MVKGLWIRELSCGHERPTNIAYMCESYIKPEIGEECFCRECNENIKIIGVREAEGERT